MNLSTKTEGPSLFLYVLDISTFEFEEEEVDKKKYTSE
jgi:hypothetical protein